MANQQTTPEERQRRREQQRERLARATEELLTSEGWRRWLRARATFHGYSLRNTLLIAQQAEERGFAATHVAGFRAWLSLDRCVRKGERGLRILAPMSVRDLDEATGEDRRRTFFREAAVFDISQTEPLAGASPWRSRHPAARSRATRMPSSSPRSRPSPSRSATPWPTATSSSARPVYATAEPAGSRSARAWRQTAPPRS